MENDQLSKENPSFGELKANLEKQLYLATELQNKFRHKLLKLDQSKYFTVDELKRLASGLHYTRTIAEQNQPDPLLEKVWDLIITLDKEI